MFFFYNSLIKLLQSFTSSRHWLYLAIAYDFSIPYRSFSFCRV
jgi:hypothetical protein